jgi:hypothetical protein
VSLLGALIVAMGFPPRPLSQKKMGRAIGRWYCPYFRIDGRLMSEAYGFSPSS